MKSTKLIIIGAISLCAVFQCSQFIVNAETSADENTYNVNSYDTDKIDLSYVDIESYYDDDEFIYTGGPIKPNYFLSYYDDYKYDELVKDIDYTVEYQNNIYPGTASVTFTGIGKYTGSVTQYFYIQKKDINYCDVYMDYIYNITSSLPKPKVRIDDTTLTEGVDYVLGYDSAPMSVGEHTLTITGIGGLEGTYEETYYVEESSIESANVTLDTDFTYNGNPQKPLPTVTINGKTLVNGKDYTLSYSNCINAGNAKVVIKGINDYFGTISKTYTIKPKVLSNVTVEKCADAVYTGKKVTPSITLKGDGSVLKSSDYTITCSNNIEPGIVKFKVKLNGNYTYNGEIPSSEFKIVLGKTANLKASPLSTNSIKLSWSKTKGCKYKVYRYNPSTKKYKFLKLTSDTTFTDKKLSEAKGYTYCVKLVYGSHVGKETVVNSHTKISAPKLTLKSYTKKAVLNWNKKNADGYEFYWCRGENYTVPHNSYYSNYLYCYNMYTLLKNVNGGSHTSFTKTKLSPNKNYHFM